IGAEFTVVICNSGKTSAVPVGKSSGKISAGMLVSDELLDEETTDEELRLELLLTELDEAAGTEFFEPELPPPPHAVSETKHTKATNRIYIDIKELRSIII